MHTHLHTYIQTCDAIWYIFHCWFWINHSSTPYWITTLSQVSWPLYWDIHGLNFRKNVFVRIFSALMCFFSLVICLQWTIPTVNFKLTLRDHTLNPTTMPLSPVWWNCHLGQSCIIIIGSNCYFQIQLTSDRILNLNLPTKMRTSLGSH